MRMSTPLRTRLPWSANWVVILAALLFAVPAAASVQTLSSAFSAAPSGSGYDTFLVLDSSEFYIGGLVLPPGNHCIVGNGAVVNLQGESVVAGSGVTLDISGLSLTNGDTGIDFIDGAMGHVECCNLYNNYNGVRAWEGTAVTLVSNNFVNNGHYGVYRHEYASVHNAYNNAWDNTDNDYVYYCPG